MATQKNTKRNPEMFFVATYFTFFAVNALVIYLGNMLFPEFIVLGTAHLTLPWAIIVSMGTLSLIDTFAAPFVREFEKKIGKTFGNNEWMAAYLAINFVGVWMVARLALRFGFGISSWMVALVLAIVLDFVQGAAMVQLEKYRHKIS